MIELRTRNMYKKHGRPNIRHIEAQEELEFIIVQQAFGSFETVQHPFFLPFLDSYVQNKTISGNDRQLLGSKRYVKVTTYSSFALASSRSSSQSCSLYDYAHSFLKWDPRCSRSIQHTYVFPTIKLEFSGL